MSRVEIPQRSRTEVCYRLGGSTDTEALTARNLFLCERACCSSLDPWLFPSRCWRRWRSRSSIIAAPNTRACYQGSPLVRFPGAGATRSPRSFNRLYEFPEAMVSYTRSFRAPAGG